MTLSLDDLMRRRNEWHPDNGSFVLLDADDCVIRVSPMWSRDGAAYAVSWQHLGNKYSLAPVASHLFDSAEEAKAWVDAAFCEHFAWFEAA